MADINPWGVNQSIGNARLGQRQNLGPTDDLVNGPTGMIVILTSTGASGFTGLFGATGLTGTQGVTGASFQGATGHQGNTGFSPSGVTGLQGATGLIGATGIAQQGATGVRGTEGITGLIFPGTTGIAGLTGTQGVQGATGLHGQTGIQGPTGLALQGVTGLQGNTGLLGGTGLAGATGVSQQGTTGVAGASGIQGVTGLFNYNNLNTQQQGAGVTGLYSVPGNTLSANEQQLEFTAWGLTAVALTTSINVVFDGFTIFNVSVGANRTFLLRGWIIRVSSTIEELTVECIFDNETVCAVQRFPGTIDLTSPQNLVVYLESASTGHVLNGFIVNRAT